jgi:hypothetical protein
MSYGTILKRKTAIMSCDTVLKRKTAIMSYDTVLKRKTAIMSYDTVLKRKTATTSYDTVFTDILHQLFPRTPFAGNFINFVLGHLGMQQLFLRTVYSG